MPLQRNIVFDKDYGKLVEQGTLTMDSGEIKNTGDGYSIKDNGIEVRLSSSDSLDRDRAYALVDGTGNVKGYLWGTTLDDSIRFVSEDNIVIEAKGGELLLAGSGGIRAVNPIRLHRLSSTAIKNLSNPKEGQVMYSTTIDDPVFYDGANWRSMLDGDAI